jgi:hypothetical protein
MLDANDQQVMQAQRDFINSILRKESGASISPAEFANAKRQYFPQPNDKPETLAQKVKNRETAVQGILEGIPETHRPSFKKPSDSWPIMTDANGNKARVNPSNPNEFVEIK